MAEQWQSPRKPIHPQTATPPTPRDYIGPALAAAKAMSAPKIGMESVVAAIIIAQALDRFGEKLIDAAAVSQYKRSP